MSRVILYIAVSLDGYIADKQGGVSWLEPFEQSGEDYGYDEFYRGLGTVIMGGVTYRQVLGFGEWPYRGVTSYIVTHRGLVEPAPPNVQAFSGDVSHLITQIKEQSDRDIWLVGGGDLVAQFVNRGLIDDYLIFAMPVLLGDGIPLLRGGDKLTPLELVQSTSHPSGVVQLHYRRRGD